MQSLFFHHAKTPCLRSPRRRLDVYVYLVLLRLAPNESAIIKPAYDDRDDDY